MIDWNYVGGMISEFGSVNVLREDEDPTLFETTAAILGRRLAEVLIKVKIRKNSDLMTLWDCLKELDWTYEDENQFDLIPMNKTCWITVEDNVAYTETEYAVKNRLNKFIEHIYQ